MVAEENGAIVTMSLNRRPEPGSSRFAE